MATEQQANTIIIVEDDEDIADTIRYNLEREGYSVRTAPTGETGLDLILGNPPNLVLLDVNLPKMNGFELCRLLRSEPRTARLPILMLTARNSESDKVLGLRLGADDYLTKPFSIRELAARVEAILRRVQTAEPDSPVYDDGILMINRATFRITFEGREVSLTRKEFGLLEELAKNAGRVMTREILLERLWGLNHFGDSRTLDVHIRRLRQKLGNSEVIETVTGIGYRLRLPADTGQ